MHFKWKKNKTKNIMNNVWLKKKKKEKVDQLITLLHDKQ